MDRSSIPKPDGQPIRRFARFFKAYNVGLSLVVAAVPILVSAWDAVPLYTNTKNYLALVTSVASYLLVGFIFSQRAAIGRLYFPAWTGAAYSRDFRVGRLFGKVPLLLLAVSVLSFYLYFPLLNRSIERIAYEYTFDKASSNTTICEAQSLSPGQRRIVPAEFVAFGVSASVTVYCASRAATTEGEPPVISYGIGFSDQEVVKTILSNAPSPSIPYSFLTSMFFVIAFLSATSAFIIMGLKEYIQEELGIKDDDLIYRHVPTTVQRRFYLEGVSGLYGTVEFSPADLTMTPRVTGPFCTWHDLTPTPKGFDQDGKTLGWVHVSMKENKRVEEPCSLVTQLSERELEMRLESGASEVMARERARSRTEAQAGANAS